MKEKFTLSIDKKGKSISQMIQSYPESLSSETDPVQHFGKHLVDTGVHDASEKYVRYIYPSGK